MASPKLHPLTVPLWHASIINRDKRVRVVIERHTGRVEWVDPYWDYDADEWRCKIRGKFWSIVAYGRNRKGWDVFYIQPGEITDKANADLKKLLEDWYIQIQRVYAAWRDQVPLIDVDWSIAQRMDHPPRYSEMVQMAKSEILRLVPGTVPQQPNTPLIQAVAGYLGS